MTIEGDDAPARAARSSSSPPRTPSSTRARTRCPRRSSTASSCAPPSGTPAARTSSRCSAAGSSGGTDEVELRAVVDRETLLEMQRGDRAGVRRRRASRRYCVDLVAATRESQSVGRRREPARQRSRCSSSRAARPRSPGRDYVLPDDVKAIAVARARATGSSCGPSSGCSGSPPRTSCARSSRACRRRAPRTSPPFRDAQREPAPRGVRGARRDRARRGARAAAAGARDRSPRRSRSCSRSGRRSRATRARGRLLARDRANPRGRRGRGASSPFARDAAVDRLELLLELPDGVEIVGDGGRARDPARRRTRSACSSSRSLRALGRVRASERSRRARAIRSGSSSGRGSFGLPHHAEGYPSPESLSRILSPVETQAFAGSEVARVKGDGIEYADIRDYVARRPPARDQLARVRADERRPRRQRAPPGAEHGRRPLRGQLLRRARRAPEHARRRGARGGDARRRATSSAGTASASSRSAASCSWLRPGMGLTQRYRLIETLLETGVAPTYTWRDVSLIPARILPPKALVFGLTPLVDSRFVTALENLRARGFDLVVVEIDPVTLVEPGPSELDRLAYRLWLLEREVLGARLERLGIGGRALGRGRVARDRSGGGEDVQALRKARHACSHGLRGVRPRRGPRRAPARAGGGRRAARGGLPRRRGRAARARRGARARLAVARPGVARRCSAASTEPSSRSTTRRSTPRRRCTRQVCSSPPSSRTGRSRSGRT